MKKKLPNAPWVGASLDRAGGMGYNVGAWKEFSYMDYAQAKSFLQILRKHSCKLTKQEYTHIKDMALSGDITAAEKQLSTILENCFNNMERRTLHG